MKKSICHGLISIGLIAACLSGCSLLSDDEDEFCESHRISPSTDASFYLTHVLDEELDHPGLDTRCLAGADEIEFIVTVRNMDCNDIESEYKSFTHYVFPVDDFPVTEVEWECNISNSIVFNFDNNRDYLSVTYKMRAIFHDGAIYESDETYANSQYYETLIKQGSPFNFMTYYNGAWHRVLK